MAEVPYQAEIPAGLKIVNSPLTLREWGETSAGVKTIGSIWLGYSRIDDPPWDGKSYWIKGVYPEYIPDNPPTGDGPAEIIFPEHTVEFTDGDGNYIGTYRTGPKKYVKAIAISGTVKVRQE